ncbi:MAG: hypothetical protein IJW52_05365 [Clostridia bacterium]|nr:hypothetical protein [Clostridia bacterium]
MDAFALLMKVCGVSLLGCVCLCIFGRLASGFSALLRIGVALAVFGAVVYMLSQSIKDIFALGSELVGNAIASETLVLMLKALGMALVSKLCADVCRDSGETALAGGVESAGRIAILVLSLPTFAKILALVGEMLGYARN